MTNRKTYPSEEIKKAIDRDFGSFDEFKKEFKEASLDIFGSGQVWLVSDDKGNLSIIKTSNQDTPIILNLIPVIGIDLWEHAYYLRYQNNRENYIDNWFNVVNWDKALSNYNNSKQLQFVKFLYLLYNVINHHVPVSYTHLPTVRYCFKYTRKT